MKRLKKKTALFNYILLSFILFLNPTFGNEEEGRNQAGGNQTLVRLLQKNQKFQFINDSDAPLAAEYNKTDFEHHLSLTKKIYDDAIKQILQRAYRDIKILHNEKYIKEITIKNQLEKYLENNELKKCAVSPEDLCYETFEYYRKLCEAVYTDFNTREFLVREGSDIIEKQWNRIIYSKQTIERLLNSIETLDETYSRYKPGIYEKKPGKNAQSEQVISLGKTDLFQKTKEDFIYHIKEINKFLKEIGRQPIFYDEALAEIGEELNFQAVKLKLTEIQTEINNHYFWNFEKREKSLEEFIQEIGGEKIHKGSSIPKFKDSSGNEHQLTAKAVIASSFLSKAKLHTNKNITILDVGFRNQQKFGSLWNDFVTAVLNVKENTKSWFQDRGEVDYISYIEEDPTDEKKDKIIIVYSGSNSQMDWGINFTTGHKHWEGLSVHEGIGWLFETSTNTYHSVLEERINNYYETHRKPNKLEIVTTGHSLGGALAGLAAFYYKKNQGRIFKKIIDPDRISVKTCTFAAPAIIHEKSKRFYENLLGVENIYRVWVEDDPVVSWTGEDSHLVQIAIQSSIHIGKSFPLGNIQDLPNPLFDWWGPHGIGRYSSHLSAYISDLGEIGPCCKNLTDILNDYIQKTHLDIYKVNREKLLSIMDDIKKGKNLSKSIVLHQGLAEHIIRYSPIIPKFIPQTVGDIRSHSPRYAAELSPLFKVKTGEKVEAKFQISGTNINYPINEKPICSISFMKSFFKKRGISLSDQSVEKYSCACYFANQIFLSPQQLDLSEIFSMCIQDKACTLEYLQDTGRGRNILEQVQHILAVVGLEKKFKAVELDLMLRTHISTICAAYSVDEKICKRFLNGRLIYKPNKDDDIGKVEFRIADLANPLESTFDLSKCGDAGKYFSISTGYRKRKKEENAHKVEIWIVPRFLIEKEINTKKSHFLNGIFPNNWSDAAPVGIIWTWGGWEYYRGWYDYLTNEDFEHISNDNLYEKCWASTSSSWPLSWTSDRWPHRNGFRFSRADVWQHEQHDNFKLYFG